MHDLAGPGFLTALWQRLRRPSTLVILCAGLLAADPLHWLPAAWTDASLPVAARLAAALVLASMLAWRLLRRPRRREVHVLVLSPRASRRSH